MRKTVLATAIILVIAFGADAGSRTMTHTRAADGIDAVVLDTGIGDVKITARQGLDEVTIEVVLTPRRGGIFSSKRKAELDVESASLKVDFEGSHLVLGINPPADDERRFEERWTVLVPARLAVALDHGVGDIHIQGVLSGIEIDSGVGDVNVETTGGDITIDLGVGTAVVKAPASSYKAAEGAGGVGDVQLTVLGETIESGGFVSHAASWKGDGKYRIEVAIGVGDAVITLE